ncbi:hypothetical protein EJB05_55038, partial [Eragrostis curvula]
MDYYVDEANAAAVSPGMAADPSSRPESFFDRMVRLARASPSSFPLAPSIPVSSVSITPTGITFVVPVVNHYLDRDGIGGGGEYDDAYRNGGFGAVGASGAAIASLPKTTVTVVREKAECAVCLEGYAIGDALRTMPCNHDFHERCIVDWLRVSRMCPLCRFKLPPADETEESDAEEEEAGEQDGDGASTC